MSTTAADKQPEKDCKLIKFSPEGIISKISRKEIGSQSSENLQYSPNFQNRYREDLELLKAREENHIL